MKVTQIDMELAFPVIEYAIAWSQEVQPPNVTRLSMIAKKLLSVAVLAGIVAISACSDIAGPSQQKTGACGVQGGSQTCVR